LNEREFEVTKAYPDRDARFGKVKWFNPDKGYGFIAPDDGGGDVFVHAKQLKESGLLSLQPAQAVRFEVVVRSDGRRAAERIAAV
jgi:CspA family cold shock protein